MTLEQLRIFVVVAERLHMTRAAEALGVTQSAVSSAIGVLEERYGVALFHRIGRHIELTEAGRIFLNEAKIILARVDVAELALTELAGLKRGTLTIHASQTIANYWLPPILCAYKRRHPEIRVSLVIGNTLGVARAVVDGSADLGLIEGEVSEPALAQRMLPGDSLTIVVASDHPWAKMPKIDPERFLESDWVLREPGSGTRAEFEEALKRAGLAVDRLRVVLELPSGEAVRTAVEAGVGATAISRLVIDSAVNAGRLHEVAFNFPARPFHVIWHRERYKSKATEALCNLLFATNAAHGESGADERRTRKVESLIR